MSKEKDYLTSDKNYLTNDRESVTNENKFSEDRGYNTLKNYNKKRKSFKGGDSLVLGLLAGVAAGAIAGLLLAPGKGSETRKNLAQKGKDTVDNLKGRVTDLVDTVSDKYLSGKTSNENSGDSNLERTRSTASHLNSGSNTNSFT
ncbi:MAG: YtxH domain-containing protein [Ferruginibacter sp.]